MLHNDMTLYDIGASEDNEDNSNNIKRIFGEQQSVVISNYLAATVTQLERKMMTPFTGGLKFDIFWVVF